MTAAAEFRVPVIQTARLQLRGRALDDFPFFVKLWADERVTQFIGGAPQSEETTWAKFLRMIGHWQAMGFGYWVVETRDSGALLGEVGFGDFRRDMSPSITGEFEAGWVLAPHAHGKGYAYEAMEAALGWALENFPDKPVSCIIEPDNAPSIRLAEKCGFAETARTIYHDTPIILFHRR